MSVVFKVVYFVNLESDRVAHLAPGLFLIPICQPMVFPGNRFLFQEGTGTGQGGVSPPARCGQEEGELAAVLSHGDSGLYGDAGVGAAFRHSAGAGRRPGAGGL